MRDEDWTDWDSGPVSRPYTVTGGRTRQRTPQRFDLLDVVGLGPRPAGDGASTPERRAILDMCREPMTVADLAAALGLPLGVVRIVLDDLVHEELIEVRVAAQQGWATDTRLLERVIEGIRAL
jgi:hypothetical protein